jgi:hypothetical protein
MSNENKPEEKTKRQQDLEARRAKVTEKVRPWSSSLISNISALKNLADLEWNFENLYNKVKAKFAPSVNREELRDFMASKGIKLKQKPHPGGFFGAWNKKA